MTFRSIVNGVKRALTSPRRLISLIIFVGYYFFLFIRPALTPGRMPRTSEFELPQVSFPPLEMIDSGVFALFSVLSIFLLMGAFGVNVSYKAADVDILFSTPISPRLVLLFRMARDYLGTLIFPLFMAIFGLRAARLGWDAFFTNMPQYSGVTLRLITIGWLLMSMAFVSLGYALSLWINRSDAYSDKRASITKYSFVVAVLGAVGYMALGLMRVGSFDQALKFFQDPLLRVVFFVATLATEFAMAPIVKSGLMSGIAGGAGLLGLTGAGIYLALRQVDWLYDMASMRAHSRSRMRELQRSGDMGAVAAEKARQGRVKVRKTFVNRLRWTGGWALLWREIIFAFRSSLPMLILMGLMSGFMVLMPAFIPARRGEAALGPMILVMQATASFMLTMIVGQTSYIEMLKRIDLLKPLPFSAAQIVWFEIVSKVAYPTSFLWLFSLIAVAIKPFLLQYAAAGILLAPGLNLMLGAVQFGATLLFPDVDDVSQRQFRGLLTMLAVVIIGAIPMGLLIGLLALKISPIVAGASAGVLCAVFGWICSYVSAQLFDGFNPAD